jgi:hypothetical protein
MPRLSIESRAIGRLLALAWIETCPPGLSPICLLVFVAMNLPLEFCNAFEFQCQQFAATEQLQLQSLRNWSSWMIYHGISD